MPEHINDWTIVPDVTDPDAYLVLDCETGAVVATVPPVDEQAFDRVALIAMTPALFRGARKSLRVMRDIVSLLQRNPSTPASRIVPLVQLASELFVAEMRGSGQPTNFAPSEN